MLTSQLVSLMKNTGPVLSEACIDAFEVCINSTLMSDYIAFVVSCNGGYVEGALFFVGVSPDEDAAVTPEEVFIDFFYGLRDDLGSAYSLRKKTKCLGRGYRAVLSALVVILAETRFVFV